MGNIDAFTLISGSDISFDGIATVVQPTLNNIRQIGFQTYQMYLNTLLLQKDTLLENVPFEERQVVESVDLYDLLCVDPAVRSLLIGAFSFFLRETVSYDNVSFCINGVPVGAKILDQVKAIIFEVSMIKQEEVKKPKFASKRAEELWYRLREGRKQFEKSKKADVNMEIPNVISAIAAKHPGYNLTNIWDLTVYQLYDQFARINTNVQLGVYGQRWAAWGKEEFDTTVWFKNYTRKE